MSDPLSEFIIVFAFGAFCFGCGYLIAFIVTRTNGEWGEPPKKPKAWEVQ
jgi:hypothetical protein